MSVRRQVFGTLSELSGATSEENQRIVHKYDIVNASGSLKVSVTEYGATLLSVQTPDRLGELEEITLNHYDDLQALATQDGKPYLGCIAGRYANRIAKGVFTLDGQEYNLAVNNGVNHLHGGIKGFDTKIWDSDIIDEASTGRLGVRFTLLSPHLDEGYPGVVVVAVEYEVQENNLLIHIYATTNAPTVLNLTNHAYWNLSGDGKSPIHDHLLHLACHHYLPVDSTQIPTGEIAPVKISDIDSSQNIFDFCTENVPKRIGEHLLLVDGGGQPGYDHCFVVDDYSGSSPGSKPTLLNVATLIDPASGRVMVVRSSQPGVQVYTANWLPLPASSSVDTSSSEDADDIDNRHLFSQHNAICLETQHFPDSPNHPDFPSTVVRPSMIVKSEGEDDGSGSGERKPPRAPTTEDYDYYELTVFGFHLLPPV